MGTIKQLLMMVALLLCSVAVSAHDFEVDGIYYKILSSTDLTVAVTYKGNAYNEFDNEYSGKIIIPSTVIYKSKTLSVTSIGKSAFEDCSALTSVTIGNSVTSIGKSAFYGCSGLNADSVTSIESYAFYGCTSLKDLRIEDGTNSLSLGFNKYNGHGYPTEELFEDCPLETLYLGRDLYHKENNSIARFYNKSTLTSVSIGNRVTSIGDDAFYGCTGLKEVHISDLAAWCNIDFESNPLSYAKNLYLNGKLVQDLVIPNGVKYIKGKAFENCNALTSVTIPISVTSIGGSAFSKCSGLQKITFNCKEIGRWFPGLTSIKEVTIGNSVTSIGSSAFSNFSGLKSITIPNSVTSIGDYAFSGCSGLTSITIPNSVTSIGNTAFRLCNGLTSVTIGNSVTSIGGYAFKDCDSLASIRLLGETPPTVYSNTFINKQYMNMIVYVPKGTLATYQAADVWKDFWDIQEFDVTAIENVEDVTPAFEITSSGIQFTAADGKAIAIYAPNGALVEKIDNYAGEEIALDKGVYIVRVGNKTMKVKL